MSSNPDSDPAMSMSFSIELQQPSDGSTLPRLVLHINQPGSEETVLSTTADGASTTTLPNGDRITVTTQLFAVDPNQPQGEFAFPAQFPLPFLFPQPSDGEATEGRSQRRFHPYIRIIPLGRPSFQGQPPASSSAVALLKKFASSTLNLPASLLSEACVVCQDSLVQSDQEGEVLLQMPCQHVFHSDCLLPWLKRSNTCPTCRWEISTDNPEYNRGVKRRMMERRILLCALADIACDTDEYMLGTETSNEEGGVQYGLVDDHHTYTTLDCTCKFHESCLARYLRVAGYHPTDHEETLEIKCPRCRKLSPVRVDLLASGLTNSYPV